jgi:hypothetical protein
MLSGKATARGPAARGPGSDRGALRISDSIPAEARRHGYLRAGAMIFDFETGWGFFDVVAPKVDLKEDVSTSRGTSHHVYGHLQRALMDPSGCSPENTPATVSSGPSPTGASGFHLKNSRNVRTAVRCTS